MSLALFTSGYLSRLRLQAIRRRVLFSALDGLERGILYLAGRVVDEVRGVTLVAQLLEIVRKLGEAMRGWFAGYVEGFGVRQAVRLVE